MSQPSENSHDPGAELKAVESALGSLRPSPGRLDRDRVLFRAGMARVSARKSIASRYGWPALAASLALVALGEGAMLAVRSEPRVVERVVYVPRPLSPVAPEVSPTPERQLAGDEPTEDEPEVVILSRTERPRPSTAAGPWSGLSTYIQLRQEVLMRGVDALPEPPPLAMIDAGEAPASSRELFRSEIQSLLNPGNPS